MKYIFIVFNFYLINPIFIHRNQENYASYIKTNEIHYSSSKKDNFFSFIKDLNVNNADTDILNDIFKLGNYSE